MRRMVMDERDDDIIAAAPCEHPQCVRCRYARVAGIKPKDFSCAQFAIKPNSVITLGMKCPRFKEAGEEDGQEA